MAKRLLAFILGAIIVRAVATYCVFPMTFKSIPISQAQVPTLKYIQTSIVKPTSTFLPVLTETPISPTQVKYNPNTILQEMKTLADRFSSKNLKPGWIHLSNQYFSYNDKGDGVLPSGGDIPKAYILEEYYHLNNERIAYEGVTFMKTLDGNIIQVNLLKKGVIKSLTFENANDVSPFSPELDGGTVRNFTSAVKDGGHIKTASAILLNGEPSTLFDILNKFNQPMKFDRFNQPVNGIEKKAYFDEDGKLIQLDVYYSFIDGTQKLDGSSTHFIVESGIVPPTEILNYLH
jgi:hypothetical protein